MCKNWKTWSKNEKVTQNKNQNVEICDEKSENFRENC